MTYNLLLAFDSDDPEFIRGFEAGRVWALMVQDAAYPDAFEPFMVHANNTEMLMRIAEASRREFKAEIIDDDWVMVEFGPVVAV